MRPEAYVAVAPYAQRLAEVATEIAATDSNVVLPVVRGWFALHMPSIVAVGKQRHMTATLELRRSG